MSTSDPRSTAITTGVTPERLAALRRWNVGLTLLHAAQAVLVLVLASDFEITITSTFPQGPPGTRLDAPEALFDMRIGVAVAIFLGLAALDHLLTATVGRRTYESDLRDGINRFRWVEYSFSATLMVILIATYAGITDVTGLVAIAGASVGMILFGWLQERTNPPGRTGTTMMPSTSTWSSAWSRSPCWHGRSSPDRSPTDRVHAAAVWRAGRGRGEIDGDARPPLVYGGAVGSTRRRRRKGVRDDDARPCSRVPLHAPGIGRARADLTTRP
jgi:hypothetical protein